MKGDNNAVIVLAGMIGAGKSTYTKLISEALESDAFYESVDDNRILEKFYEDPKRWAFSLQIYFLNTRFRSIKQALQHQHNVLDRSIYEDALFTKINHQQGNMSDAEMDTYLDLLDNMMEELDSLPKKAPDLLIYLRGSLDTVLSRIKKRGRSFEQIDGNEGLLDYYTLLHSHYDDWFDQYDKSATLVIDIDQHDLENPADAEKIIQLIHNKLENMN
ncbi:deoxynucleoside kinase [Carnobacterium divergens]|uniref:Deoxynucleoside kinase n=1 Tax=Carnobacterium divergens TaxID=2748 RepID=A0AAW8R714_CARDV|nr:deoxynucleoside kinase [Carnobacterium divergens]MDT1958282.1 deoxynucleoside kinase [Carnobacterium divergens]MDT1973549.1 deoxynucleoside kinase [Carnobacterium divergens]MDT2011498.1 deoxynucleoside kinase [Carnobacterium divergens]TFI93732.1 deoxynucleoside kinase [Carnobacterium divergens]TFJ44441.1 deoxynucleoside kinase [Carnobacterium divergens]